MNPTHPDSEAPLDWNQPARQAEAETWIAQELARRGRRIRGAVEQVRLRPWSCVLRAPADGGAVYFKAVARGAEDEVRLTGFLAERQQRRVPALLAADPARGWMLLDNGGPRLRELLQTAPGLEGWQSALRDYAQLQVELSAFTADLLALGVPDRRLAALPALYARLIESSPAADADLPEALTPRERTRLKDLTALVEALCARLADCGVPESLNHGDFHDGNILRKDGRYLFFDWGDASLAHPFFSLRTALVSMENTLGFAENAPEFAGPREAYLEPFQVFAPLPVLRKTLALSARLAPLCSALSWQRALPGGITAEMQNAVLSLLREFLELNNF